MMGVKLKFLSPYVYSRNMKVKPIELTPKRCKVRFMKCSFINGWNLAMIQPDVMCESSRRPREDLLKR